MLKLSSSNYNRQYSYIGEKEDGFDDQDFESRDNTILLKNRGGCKQSADMSKVCSHSLFYFIKILHHATHCCFSKIYIISN